MWMMQFNGSGGLANNINKKNYATQGLRTMFAFTSATPAYIVSYDANGGSGAPDEQVKDGGSSLTLTSAEPTRDGYTFTGWNTAADGNGTSYAAGDAYTTDDDVKLYAQWVVSKVTLTLTDGGVDADHWTITPAEATTEGVTAGTTVTLEYDGDLKVESVTAEKVLSPATVATAPTAKADVKAGSTNALVEAGVADGGTMMYAVTTENTKPTSTEGFSENVPTAQTCTAATYYVWYYVKADSRHSDSEISATAVEVTVRAITVESITLNKTATAIIVGMTETLSVTAVTPNNATDQSVTWSSSDETKATVDQYGKVTAVAVGTATITATANDGSGVTATCAVTVKAPTLAETLTIAGMSVKVKYNYADEVNHCLFVSNGNGTYTFQSGSGYGGGNANRAKALVVEDGKLVFKQNVYNTITLNWDTDGYSVTFDTSNNYWNEWKGDDNSWNPSFTSVEVNGMTISVTKLPTKITVDDLVKDQYQMWYEIVDNNPDKIYIDEDDYTVKRISDGARLMGYDPMVPEEDRNVEAQGAWDSYDQDKHYYFEGDE